MAFPSRKNNKSLTRTHSIRDPKIHLHDQASCAASTEPKGDDGRWSKGKGARSYAKQGENDLSHKNLSLAEPFGCGHVRPHPLIIIVDPSLGARPNLRLPKVVSMRGSMPAQSRQRGTFTLRSPVSQLPICLERTHVLRRRCHE